jgi:hypothetical protein
VGVLSCVVGDSNVTDDGATHGALRCSQRLAGKTPSRDWTKRQSNHTITTSPRHHSRAPIAPHLDTHAHTIAAMSDEETETKPFKFVTGARPHPLEFRQAQQLTSSQPVRRPPMQLSSPQPSFPKLPRTTSAPTQTFILYL